MTEINYLDKPHVELVQATGGDESILWAARVSTGGDREPLPEGYELSDRDKGLIGYLMREKHGSPFEHNSMTVYVEAPLFVFREFQRHRIGFSYNEASGRYSVMEPNFWLTPEDRPLVNAGKPSKPEMVKGTAEQARIVREAEIEAYAAAWKAYEKMIAADIASEVARTVLPVGLYSKMYVTMNLRSAFALISLRTHEPEAAHVSRPQLEIDQTVRLIEAIVAERFPVAYEHFNKNGRVAP